MVFTINSGECSRPHPRQPLRLKRSTAQLYLHKRRYSLYNALAATSSEALQQLRQFPQIRSAKKRTPCGDLHKWIDACRIGAARWNRLQLSFPVEEIHAILAPVVAVFDQFELLPE